MTYIKQKTMATLYRSNKTVFSTRDLGLMWNIENADYLKTKINRLIKAGDIFFIRKGFYSLDPDYLKVELANKMIAPSYVSLNSVLAWEGVIFQYDPRIYSVAGESRIIKIENQEYIYQKIKDEAFLNPLGIRFDGTTSIASKERAIVDMLYLEPDFYFDKLINVDWKLCLQIAKNFNNKKLLARLKKIKEEYA